MREMKDSGVEWVGKVPATWKIMPNKYIMTKKKVIKEVYDDENIISLSMNGVIVRDLEAGGKMPKTFDGYQIVYPDNLLMCLFDYDVTPRCIGLIKEYGVTSPAYSQFVMNNGNYSGYYYYYYLMVDHTKALLHLAKNLRHSFTEEQLGAILAPVPTIEEQQQIADYLDTKCSEIDAIAEDIQKEISLLEEYKKSVITEAVTKGLNPDAEMKDSGIKWIGKIPINWQAVNPRWLFAQRKDRAKKGMEQYTASQKYGVISQKDYMNRIGGSIVTVQKDFDILKMVCEGDFVIHMRSFQGGLEYSEHTGSISSAYVMLIPKKNAVECRYFKWLFKSASYINALQSTSNLIRDGQAMRYSNFIQIIIPYPPLEEQQQIADFLDAKCSEIDALIADKKRQLYILAEYKKSLIYEYVTGKKEVPVHE